MITNVFIRCLNLNNVLSLLMFIQKKTLRLMKYNAMFNVYTFQHINTLGYLQVVQ